MTESPQGLVETAAESPARLAPLKLQGRYVGTMRGLPAAKGVRTKKLRAEKGIRAAIAEARRMVG